MAPWVTASHWAVTGERFVVKADLSEVMDEHGPGVYTVVVWGTAGEEEGIGSQYSIFHGVESPDTYGR